MKQTIFAFSVLAVALTFAESASVKKEVLSPEEIAIRQKKMAEVTYRNTGGRCVNPKSGEGKVVLKNAQTKIPAAKIQPVVDKLSMRFCVKIEIQDGKPLPMSELDAAAKATGGAITIFLVEDGSLPLSLVAYENGWALVNLSKLEGESERVFLNRLEIEIARTFALTGGVAYGMGTAGLMKPVRTSAALDDCQLPNEKGNNYITGPIHRYLLHFGLLPITVASYARACRDGWAPAPTNDVQKALWEKARVKREQGPTNPIKILPKK